jgi:hypothetical protein
MLSGAEAPPSAQPGEWPLAIAATICQVQPALYQAVLRLERAGAAVIERPLADAALVLSVNSCVVLHSEEEFQVPAQHS